jgi:hypothetical protein
LHYGSSYAQQYHGAYVLFSAPQSVFLEHGLHAFLGESLAQNELELKHY